jgi:Leucine-rich repeat (LRR) protein
MTIDSLKIQLLEAYSVENLNELTSSIIDFYRNKQQRSLIQICSIINDFYFLADTTDKKLFSKLIMMYHPDKILVYRKAISDSTSSEALQYFAHILPVLGKLKQLKSLTDYEVLPPNEFEEEYGWSYMNTDDDYYLVREDDETVQGLYDEENADGFGYYGVNQELPEGSFIEAVKRKIYGPMQVNFPVHQLEDMEEIEMAEYEIEDLTGIEYCTYVAILDLSYNQIVDISALENCKFIQELYLPGNQIYYIDSLCDLTDLRVADLSNNKIEDISPLFSLKALEFVNLMGNNLPPAQINQLKANGVVVVA